jgi:hypothetical protein
MFGFMQNDGVFPLKLFPQRLGICSCRKLKLKLKMKRKTLKRHASPIYSKTISNSNKNKNP